MAKCGRKLSKPEHSKIAAGALVYAGLSMLYLSFFGLQLWESVVITCGTTGWFYGFMFYVATRNTNSKAQK